MNIQHEQPSHSIYCRVFDLQARPEDHRSPFVLRQQPSTVVVFLFGIGLLLPSPDPGNWESGEAIEMGFHKSRKIHLHRFCGL